VAGTASESAERGADKVDKIDLLTSIPFLGVHAVALVGVFLVEFEAQLLLWLLGSYLLRTWTITGGYHRYFAHRSYRTSRAFQFVIALLGTLSMQKGPLWWAAHHRAHHRHADQDEDIHSPTLRGLYWSHMGWILCSKYKDTDWARVRDLAKFPELRWLDRYHAVPPIVAGAVLWFAAGPAVFIWAGLVATVVEWHALFTANSLCHVFGSRRFDTRDTSRNNALFGVLLLGEGWHNNHHHYPGAARQGFYWWEVDVTYYVLRALEAVGLVWDVRGVPERVLARVDS